MRPRVIAAAVLLVLGAPAVADAFCGFYVSGADARLFNNATQVVMMRAGTRTVLSMQNNYQGPTEDFAMVVPVPVVLQKENVKTLPREIFDHVDRLGAPRLVEYWEQDPCAVDVDEEESGGTGTRMALQEGRMGKKKEDLGVRIEAKFTVGEYQIVILSAKDSTGLDTWLRQEKYKIPEGAAPYLKPYVEAGSKFFVAKVDAKKVVFENGQAMLSPLRFHYDSEQFTLPIRLGMMNSAGTQDLIVNILAPQQRYEVANYKNVTIPTNLDVKEEARERFGEFYAALFDRTLEKNPGAVVTEYSWDARSCDPCPTPALDPSELAILGGDVLATPAGQKAAPATKGGRGKAAPPPPPPALSRWFVLTRLHARYSKDGINEDLVFKTAPAIQGGRESMGENGKLEEGAIEAEANNFQGRYAIRHEWTGPIACKEPVRGVWGGPPDGREPSASAATGLAFAPRGNTQLAQIVRQDVPEIGLKTAVPRPSPEAPRPAQPPANGTSFKPKKEKYGCAVGGEAACGWLALFVLGLALPVMRRRRSCG
jgi:hypothetical protein